MEIQFNGGGNSIGDKLINGYLPSKIPAQLNGIQFFCHENQRILWKILLDDATLCHRHRWKELFKGKGSLELEGSVLVPKRKSNINKIA